MPTPPDPRTTEALPSNEPLRARVRERRLTVVGGEHDGLSFVFASERIVIGADPRADFVLAEPTLSKFHCEIRISEGVSYVRDLGSRNGTAVDRVPVIEAPLRHGAMLTLGRAELRFEIGAREVEMTLSSRQQFGRLRGASIPMRAVFALLEAAAAGSSTVLLQGESGTGKDLAAEAIHTESARRDGPFVVVDCGALPAHLLEAELFGYEAGAFTGASTARAGAFEAAAGGTVLLDEIGELALDLQPKLLRVLEQRELRRVGGTKTIKVDLRVIAATRKDLRSEVEKGKFREDLYFRLSVVPITAPALRERREDIPLLIDAMLKKLAASSGGGGAVELTEATRAALMAHDWPGNVRELAHFAERVVLGVLNEPPAPSPHQPDPDTGLSLPERMERYEARILRETLAAHQGEVKATLQSLGIPRKTFYDKLQRHGIERQAYAAPQPGSSTD